MTASLGRALDTAASYEAHPTVNQLVYKVHIHFGEPLNPKNKQLIWNIIQKYAAKNDCLTQNNPRILDQDFYIEIGMKHRLGFPRREVP